jgi:tRNA(Arg) A34 adenosine deaminase TadA
VVVNQYERGVASVLQSAAVKKIVPLLSTRVERIFLCLAAILNFRNTRVVFIMAKRHPVRNSQFTMAIRDVHSFFQEERLKIRNSQQVLSYTAIMERVCALKVSPLAYEYRKYVENRF